MVGGEGGNEAAGESRKEGQGARTKRLGAKKKVVGPRKRRTKTEEEARGSGSRGEETARSLGEGPRKEIEGSGTQG